MSVDYEDIDGALVALLAADSALTTAMPNGVHADSAPPGSTKFVIVQLQHGADEYVQPATSAFFDATYLVKAVSRDTSSLGAKAAAKRIHAVLQNATLTVAGYQTMIIQRTERIRYQEPDENTDLLWQHRGGLYEIMTSPA